MLARSILQQNPFGNVGCPDADVLTRLDTERNESFGGIGYGSCELGVRHAHRGLRKHDRIAMREAPRGFRKDLPDRRAVDPRSRFF